MGKTSAFAAGKVAATDISAFNPRENPPLMKPMGKFALRLLIFGLGLIAALWIGITIGKTLGVLAAVVAYVLVVGIPLLRFAGAQVRYAGGVDTLLARADFSEALLGKEVLGTGVTLGRLIDDVNALARSLGTPGAARTGDQQRHGRAALLWMGTAVVMIIGTLVTILADTPWGLVLTWPLPIFTALRTRRWLHPNIDEVRAVDPRKPLLLLRSFKDDRISLADRSPSGLTAARRFEQGIAGTLGAFGPLVAIGRPGERLPQLGAARVSLGEADWQPAVMGFVEEAFLIVMIAGPTEWIRWEIQRILELGRFRHFLIVLPPRGSQARWANVLEAFAGSAWHSGLSVLDLDGLLLVQLEPGGDVHVVRGQKRPELRDYRLALAVAIYRQFCMGVR